MYCTLVEAVLAHEQDIPTKMAVALKDKVISYGELASRMRSAASVLSNEYGIHRRDLVAVSAVKRPDYIVALLAIQYIGATAVLLDKAPSDSTVRDIFQTIQPKLVITDSKPENVGNKLQLKELCAKSTESLPSFVYELPAPEDIGEILFTTGTTGRPKGVILTYDNIAANMENTWYGNGMQETDRILHPLPLHHSYGMRVFRSALWGGASIILQNVSSFAKDIEIDIKRHKCTVLITVPATIELFQRQLGDRFADVMGALRYIEVGAGALSVVMRKKLLQELPKTELHTTWGSTETGGALFLNLTQHPEKIASAGKPLSNIELKVLDSNRNARDAHDIDTAGRMALRGRMQMSGYYGMPEATAETLVDGWLLTNDLVYTDSDGYVYMLGRADDIINVGGEKVAPIEIEQAAQEYAEIRECACLGVDDPDGLTGSAPILYVVPEKNFQEAELTKHLMNRLERFKLPKRVVPVQALPRNRMQKLDRKALKQMWLETGDAPLTNDVIRCLCERRSIRDFTNRPVPKAYLDVILQTGISAPSGHNLQSWQFTVLRDSKKIVHLKEVLARVSKGKKVHFYGFNDPAAVILLSNDKRNKNGVQDCACAAENMMLAAHSLGLGSVWNNAISVIYDEPEVRDLLSSFHIPETHAVVAALLFGWAKEPGKMLSKKQDVICWVEDT